jgi:hypothetical protein
MNSWKLRALVAVVILLALAVPLRSQLTGSGVAGRLAPEADSGPTPAQMPTGSEPVDMPGGITVGQDYHHDLSRPLRDLPIIHLPATAPHQVGAGDADAASLPINGHVNQADTVVQKDAGSGTMPATNANFDGIQWAQSDCNCTPPDTNGDVGPNDYVQIVNTAFAVFDKATGNIRYGPAAINTVWQGFGGLCESQNSGDPVMNYDSIANRWVISQFTTSTPYNECVAVSQTGDPTGAWYRYAFNLGSTNFPDYPKISVWNDAYYMTVNQFRGGAIYQGPQPYALDRTSMLSGKTASYITISRPLGASANPMLPADFDGTLLPATGTPGIFLEEGSNMNLFTFKVNFKNPTQSKWVQRSSLAVAPFTQLCPSTRSCIPQKGTTAEVDGLGDRLMYRLAYRNFGSYASLVTDQSVDVGSGRAGVRWYEIRITGTSISLYQQGTYAPSDGEYRWMGSTAMDKAGDLAVGYSISGTDMYPSIRYAGRLSTDPLGQLSQGEADMYDGSGYDNTGYSRWGDYSAMQVDPTDDCTFWYTQEYNNSDGWAWGTRIASFKFPNCS